MRKHLILALLFAAFTGSDAIAQGWGYGGGADAWASRHNRSLEMNDDGRNGVDGNPPVWMRRRGYGGGYYGGQGFYRGGGWSGGMVPMRQVVPMGPPVPTIAGYRQTNFNLAAKQIDPMCGKPAVFCGPTIMFEGLRFQYEITRHGGDVFVHRYPSDRDPEDILIRIRADHYWNAIYPRLVSQNPEAIAQAIDTIATIAKQECLLYSEEYAGKCFGEAQTQPVEDGDYE